MKSGVPWQVKGVGRHARDTAREAARRSGMSVGEWLDTVIVDSAMDEGIEPAPTSHAEDDDWYRDGEERVRPKRHRYSDYDDRHRRAPDEDLSAVHDRLENLSHQLDHLARANAANASLPRHRDEETPRRLGDAISRLDRKLDQLITEGRSAASQFEPRVHAADRILADVSGNPVTPLDHALLEIAERQRALDGDAAPAPPDLPRAPTQGLPGLERQLRDITARIETLQPCGADRAVEMLRDDLAEIRLMLQTAQPRREVEALEDEVGRLSQRLHHKRGGGSAIAGIERGLAEVRDALRVLTPAENLVGFDEAVKGLSDKIDRIAGSNQDPAAMQQLEGAIVALRGIVSHVASNDALTKLSDEVRSLAGKVEQAASGADVLSILEQRIATIADALQSRNQGGQNAPRELEAVIKGLTDKLERIQLTRSDHMALGHLEDRIVKLVEKLDASDARLNHLEAIERGLAELLIHLEHQRVPQVVRGPATTPRPVDTLKRDVARTEDSLEAVHGTLGHVVDRLAMIETDMRGSGAPRPQPGKSPAAAPPPSPPAPVATPATAASAPAPNMQNERQPIDPNLPPDHPLEPGAARARPLSSPSERIAASEAALGPAKPPVIPDPGGKSDFIAAARRAAQAASVEAPARNGKRDAPIENPAGGGIGSRLGKTVRSMLAGTSVVLIALGSLYIAGDWFSASGEPPARQAYLPPPSMPLAPAPAPPARRSAAAADGNGTSVAAAAAGTVPPIEPERPVASAANLNGTNATAVPDREATGSISQTEIEDTPPAPAAPLPPSRPTGADKLPAGIGSGGLRAAAVRGDPTAEYEIAVRFAEGRGVPRNLAAAAEWFERAAKQGIPPAQFRLGGLYEKGLGVKKDLEAARRLYVAAAEAGNAKAMHNLAVLYAEGIEGKPDYKAAAMWFRKAADHGVADSQYNLGILYARGIGVEQNFAEAYRWFALAARRGDKESGKKRDDVGRRLDQQSLKAAQLAAQLWTPQPQPDAAIHVKVPTGGWDGVAAASPKRRLRTVGPKIERSSPRPAQ